MPDDHRGPMAQDADAPPSSPPDDGEKPQLPAVSEDGLEKAIEGLSLEINRLLAERKTLNTFETVQQIARVGHQVVLLRTLLRDLSVQDLKNEDIEPDDIAGAYANNSVGYPIMGGGRGTVSSAGGLEGRVARRLLRNRPGARHRNPFGIVPVEQGPFGHGDFGAPFCADQGDLQDDPVDLLNQVLEALDAKTREQPDSPYVAARELRALIRDLKDERASLMREHGDEHPDLPDLNVRIDQLKERLDEYVAQIVSKSSKETHEDDKGDPGATPTVQTTLHCTQCDQTQNQFWKTTDGTPMPCDICGAPMQPVEPQQEVRQDNPSRQTSQPPPRGDQS